MDPSDKGLNEGWSSYMRRTDRWVEERPQSLGFLLWPLLIGVVLVVVGWTLLASVGIWVVLRRPLRWALETALSPWVARFPAENGQPIHVAAVIAAVVVVAVVGVSAWRRGVAQRVVLGEARHRSLLLASLVRTLVLFAGSGLILVSSAIATGADLGSSGLPISPAGAGEGLDAVPVLIFAAGPLVVIGAHTWLSRGAAWHKAARKHGV